MVRLRSATNTLFYPMSYEANFNLAKYIIFAISLHKMVYKIKSFYATSGKNTSFTFPHCHILSGRSTGKTPTCGTKKLACVEEWSSLLRAILQLRRAHSVFAWALLGWTSTLGPPKLPILGWGPHKPVKYCGRKLARRFVLAYLCPGMPVHNTCNFFPGPEIFVKAGRTQLSAVRETNLWAAVILNFIQAIFVGSKIALTYFA